VARSADHARGPPHRAVVARWWNFFTAQTYNTVLTTGFRTCRSGSNITIDKDVHERLQHELPAKGISRFINDAIRAQLRPSRDVLNEAYKAAARERWRKAEDRDWSVTDVEEWPA
jgi:hypothetical protein